MCEIDFAETLNRDGENNSRNTILIPVLKNAARKFQDMRGKAEDREDQGHRAMEFGKTDGGKDVSPAHGSEKEREGAERRTCRLTCHLSH